MFYEWKDPTPRSSRTLGSGFISWRVVYTPRVTYRPYNTMLRHSHGNVCAEIAATKQRNSTFATDFLVYVLNRRAPSVQVLIADTCLSPRRCRIFTANAPNACPRTSTFIKFLHRAKQREGRGRGQLAWRSPVRHFALTHRVASCLLPSPGLVEHGGQNVCLLCAPLTQIFHSPLSCLPAIDAPSSLGKDGVVDACGSLNDLPLNLKKL